MNANYLLPLLLLAASTTCAAENVCKPGARVTDRQNRSGTVIEAQKSDCKVKLDDGTERYYIAWMLSAAGGAPVKKGDVGGVLPTGSYHCVAAGGIAGTLQLNILDDSQYSGRDGKKGNYAFDAASGKINFKSGSWSGYYGKLLGPGRIGISSRDNGYYGTSCDLK